MRVDRINNDEGALAGATLGDDGGVDIVRSQSVVTQEFFDNGIRTRVVRTDVNDTKRWQSVDIFFDADGNVTGKSRLRDDGVLVEEVWQDGVKQQVTRMDVGGNQPWERVEITYDAAGELTGKSRLRDDGVTVDETWSNGAIVTRARFDPPGETGTGVHGWKSVEATFDHAYWDVVRLTYLDDGVERLVYRNDRDEVTAVDEVDNSADGSARTWVSRSLSLQPGSTEPREEIIFDNGIHRVDWTLQDAKTLEFVLIRWEFDAPSSNGGAGNFDWFGRHSYTAGGREVSIVTYDNGDTIVEANDTEVSYVVEIDGDESDAWYARETRRLEGGAAEEIIYDTEGALREEKDYVREDVAVGMDMFELLFGADPLNP